MTKIRLSLVVSLALTAFLPVVQAADVHSVWGEKPLYLVDGQTGASYQAPVGTASLNWKDKTRYGFVHAVATPAVGPALLRYEFILVSISSCSDDYIEGLWDIYKNGALVVQGGVGRAYGIDQPVHNYFKIYVGDSKCYAEKWHFSAYITNRLDY